MYMCACVYIYIVRFPSFEGSSFIKNTDTSASTPRTPNAPHTSDTHHTPDISSFPGRICARFFANILSNPGRCIDLPRRGAYLRPCVKRQSTRLLLTRSICIPGTVTMSGGRGDIQGTRGYAGYEGYPEYEGCPGTRIRGISGYEGTRGTSYN